MKPWVPSSAKKVRMVNFMLGGFYYYHKENHDNTFLPGDRVAEAPTNSLPSLTVNSPPHTHSR
jgi:hypothetical protein